MEEAMPKYRIVYKSCTQWNGTEQESGDTGEVYETKDIAEAKKKELELQDKGDIMQAAIEAQGCEGWLEIQEIEE
jgi:hypothetical protein